MDCVSHVHLVRGGGQLQEGGNVLQLVWSINWHMTEKRKSYQKILAKLSGEFYIYVFELKFNGQK